MLIKNKNEMNQTKEQRLETVNKIVYKISNTGRKFFSYQGKSDKFVLEGGKVCLHDSYKDVLINVETKNGYPPKGFHMGGTLWGLTKDFIDFIQNGGYTNHKNGYGGLYCPHWGYPEEAMNEIIELAIELGYLIKDKKP